jgi:uncharacterized protein YijF (DUF1287 family)
MGHEKSDTNIDQKSSKLRGFSLKERQKLLVSDKAQDYKTGDIVTWMINGKLPQVLLNS